MTEMKTVKEIIEVQEDAKVDVTYREIKDPYGFIYITTNLINGKRYLGQKIFDRKWKTYLGSGVVFKAALKKYGAKNFHRDIILVCYSADELSNAEYELSVFFDVVESDDWYNLVLGGGTTAGVIVSEETRAKLSAARKRNNIIHPEYNEHHSRKMIEFYEEHPEAKQDISDRFKQLWQDQEYVEKMSQAHKEYWDNDDNRITRGAITKETWKDPNVRKARLSGLKEWTSNPENHSLRSEISKRNWDKPGFRENQINRNIGSGNPMYNVHRYGVNSARFIPVYCVELNAIYWGAKQAENDLGVNKSDIASCCKKQPGHCSAGKHPITKEKLHWLYAEDAIKQQYITQQQLDEYLNNLREKENDK